MKNWVFVSLVVLVEGTQEADWAGGGAKYFVSTDLNLNRVFLLTWPVARKIYYSKRKGKKKEKKDWFGTPTWQPFYDWFGPDQYCELDFRC